MPARDGETELSCTTESCDAERMRESESRDVQSALGLAVVPRPRVSRGAAAELDAAVRRVRRFRFAWLAPATLVVLLLMQSLGAAQDVTEPALKAAFIYNFAKFTDWPAQGVTVGGPFVICVLGDAKVSDALERAIKNRLLAGQNMTVSLVATAGPPRTCRVLYVSGVTASEAAQAVVGLRDEPVLTISDVERFAEMGGIAQFYFDHGQLRFSVDRASVKRARLQISSKLLSLSKVE